MATNPLMAALATPEARQRYQAYCLALGEFIDCFARAEVGLHIAFKHLTKMPDPVARALLSGARIEVTIGYLRRLAEVEFIDATEWKELEPVLTHLNEINDVRNSLLHYGAQKVEEGKAFITNVFRALTLDRVVKTPISPMKLSAMTYDLRKIYLHLSARHMGRDDLTANYPEVKDVLAAAWRYIHVPPPQKPTADKPQKRRSRHR